MVKFVNAKKEKIQAVKKFTDREEPRKIFRDSLEESIRDDSGKVSVIDFYGIGGIGKTALLMELKKTLCGDYPKVKYIVMDFAAVVDLGDTLEILRAMERMMRERYGFSFPFFDLVAYTYETKLGKLATRPELESIVESNQEFGFLVDVMDEIPFVDTISKVIKLAGFAKRGKDIVKERLTNRRFQEKLSEVDKKSAQEIKKELGYYFAKDLAQNTARLDEPFVVIFDTYEALVNEFTAGVPLDNDLFIRGPMGLIENAENVLWVVSGREKLKWIELDGSWEGSLKCWKIGELSYADAKWFLNEAGIIDEELVKGIYDLTKGVPVYLDLCVDMYYSVKADGREPTLKDFGMDTGALVNRFCSYMGDMEKDFIMFLAFLNGWTDETIEKIVTEKGMVFSPSLYEKIKVFSVVVQEGERYYVCAAVREILIDNAPATIRKKFEKDVVNTAKKAVKELSAFEQHRLDNYEKAKKLRVTVRESYNALERVGVGSKDAEILREYLAPDAMRIAEMVRKEPDNAAVVALLEYYIRFHVPYYVEGHYKINEWEEVRAVAEKALPVGSIYLAKLYMDRPFNKDKYEQYWINAAEIIFKYHGDDKAMLVETILTWLGQGDTSSLFSRFTPYGIHSMARIWNGVKRLGSGIDDIYDNIVIDAKVEDDFTKMRMERKALERDGVRKVVQTLRRNPDLLTARVLKLMTVACGTNLDEGAHAMLLAYALEIEEIVYKTTDAEILMGYARMIFEFLGGEGNMPSGFTMNEEKSRRATEILRDIRPRYEEVFGKDAEIVALIICYTRKHQVHEGAQAMNELLGDLAERFGVGTETFAKVLRLVSLEYYNEFSGKKQSGERSDLLKLRVLKEWSKKHLEISDDEMVRKGFSELEEAFYEKFPELKEKPKPKKVLASDNSPSRARLEAEAIRRQRGETKKRKFGLFGRK